MAPRGVAPALGGRKMDPRFRGDDEYFGADVAYSGRCIRSSFPLILVTERESSVSWGMKSAKKQKRQIKPAPRAHLYLAPSTATGISVEYGYAGMP